MAIFRILQFIVIRGGFVARPVPKAVTLLLEKGMGHLIETCLVLRRFPIMQVIAANPRASEKEHPRNSKVVDKGLAAHGHRVAIVKGSSKFSDAWDARGGLPGVWRRHNDQGCNTLD